MLWTRPRSRVFAIVLIVIGIMSLLLGTAEHRHNVKALRDEFGDVVPRSLATAIGSLVSVLGLLGLVIVVLRQCRRAALRCGSSDTWVRHERL